MTFLYGEVATSVAVVAVLLVREVDTLPLQSVIMELDLELRTIAVVAPAIQHGHTRQAQVCPSRDYTHMPLVLSRLPAESTTQIMPGGTHSFQEWVLILTLIGNLCHPLEEPGQDSNVSQPDAIDVHLLMLQLHGTTSNKTYMQIDKNSPYLVWRFLSLLA
jgi:hypothetical protein